MVNQKWKEIWEKRQDNFLEIDFGNPEEVFTELKRIDGFDVVRGGIPREALLKQHQEIVGRLSKDYAVQSIFEVGCGCGADLYLLSEAGYQIGGMDYSKAQIEIAKEVFHEDENVRELLCDEASALPVDVRYDAVFSNSVFSYFPSEEYAGNVLDLMRDKTQYSIGLVDVHDVEKKEDFVAYRRKTVENYEERYKGLDKFFYSKDFFQAWAERNDFAIEFYSSDVEGYWNSAFVFDVYLYRKGGQ